MQQLQSRLLGYSSGLMSDPSSGLAPMKTNAQENINRRYAGAPTAVSAQLARRGLGSSGAAGGALFGLESSRLGDMSNLESNFASLTSQRQMQGAGLGESLLQLGRGTTTTGNMPDQSAAAGFGSAGNALSDLSRVLMFNNAVNVLKNNQGNGPPNPAGSVTNYPQPMPDGGNM